MSFVIPYWLENYVSKTSSLLSKLLTRWGGGDLKYTIVRCSQTRFSFHKILYLLSKLCKFASHNYIAWTAFWNFFLMLSIGSFFTAKVNHYVSPRKRNIWFCLISFSATAGLWRLIQKTALISGIDWRDTVSATNSHVTFGKSLIPH